MSYIFSFYNVQGNNLLTFFSLKIANTLFLTLFHRLEFDTNHHEYDKILMQRNHLNLSILTINL